MVSQAHDDIVPYVLYAAFRQDRTACLQSGTKDITRCYLLVVYIHCRLVAVYIIFIDIKLLFITTDAAVIG